MMQSANMEIRVADPRSPLSALNCCRVHAVDAFAKELQHCVGCAQVWLDNSYATDCGHVMCGVCLGSSGIRDTAPPAHLTFRQEIYRRPRCGLCGRRASQATKVNHNEAIYIGLFKCDCGYCGPLDELVTHVPNCSEPDMDISAQPLLEPWNHIPWNHYMEDKPTLKPYRGRRASWIPSYGSQTPYPGMADYLTYSNKPYSARPTNFENLLDDSRRYITKDSYGLESPQPYDYYGSRHWWNKPHITGSTYSLKDDYVGSRDWYNNPYGSCSPYSVKDHYPNTKTDGYKPYSSARSAYPSTTYGGGLWDPKRSSAYSSTVPYFHVLNGDGVWARQLADASWLYKFEIAKLEQMYAKKTVDHYNNVYERSNPIDVHSENVEMRMTIEIVGEPPARSLLEFVYDHTRCIKIKRIVMNVPAGNGATLVGEVADRPGWHHKTENDIVLDSLNSILRQDVCRQANSVITIGVTLTELSPTVSFAAQRTLMYP